MNAIPRTLAITVANGTGTGTFNAFRLNSVGFGVVPPAVVAPAPLANYSIDFTDPDGFGVAGRADCNGVVVVRDRFQCWDILTVTISLASIAGVYNVKLWCVQSDGD